MRYLIRSGKAGIVADIIETSTKKRTMKTPFFFSPVLIATILILVSARQGVCDPGTARPSRMFNRSVKAAPTGWKGETTKRRPAPKRETVEIGGPKPFIKQAEIAWEPAGENVRRQIMGWNKQSMMVKVEFLKAGAIGAVHTHPHLQNSIVARGKFEVTIGDQKTVLSAGDGYFVDPDIPHGVVCLEPGTLIDAFTPYRADFVESVESNMKK